MITHAQAKQLIHEPAVTEAGQSALAEHLAACESCRAYAAEIRSLGADLSGLMHHRWDAARSNLQSHRIQESLRRPPMPSSASNLMRLAATTAIVVALMAVVNWVVNNQGPQPLTGGPAIQTEVTETPVGTSTPSPITDTSLTPLPDATITSTPFPYTGTSFPSPTPNPVVSSYTVVEGDTCNSIAVRYQMPVQLVMTLNGLTSQCEITVGQVLSLLPPYSLIATYGSVAYDSDPVGDGQSIDIYVMQPDGTDPVNLTNDPAADYAPAWSPDGTRLAFLSNRTGQSEVFVVGSDGTNVLQLSHSDATKHYIGPLTWSSDGLSIVAAYQQQTDEAQATAGIDLIAAHLSSAITIYQSSTDWAGAPRWSPDGSLLAFSADEQKLIVGKVEGTTFTPLWEKAHPDCIDVFDWSPDGSQLACIANGHLAIYNSADGTSALNTIAFQPNGQAWTMAWGRKYIAVYVGADDNAANSILIINPDGMIVMEVTSSALGASRPFSWSSDGQWLIFAETTGQIYALNVLDGGLPPIPLAADTGFNREPQWQPIP